MYLVTSPDEILIGARETLQEAKDLVVEHVMKTLRERAVEHMKRKHGAKDLRQMLSGEIQLVLPSDDNPQDPLLTLADPKWWADYLSRYRFSKV